jgi:molybdenum cofactor cytidylyltransferase
MSNIGIVILAAGESRRMGSPKQLLKVGNQTLIRRTIDIALATDLRPVVLVIGANKAAIAPEIVDLPITIIDNPMWEQGMSSSVKMGMAALWMTQKEVEAVLILVCDQPYISVSLLENIVENYQTTQKPIVACRYSNEIGVPALFDRSMFEELLTLTGDKGAKPVIIKNLDKTNFIDFDKGMTDLDTPEEYQAYLSRH